jgi:hypothetical protein
MQPSGCRKQQAEPNAAADTAAEPVPAAEQVRSVDPEMSDERTYSVNEVVASLDDLNGRTVRIACVLDIEFEGDSIWHTPTAERHPGYASSLWANFDCDAIGRQPHQLEEFNGRHVVVDATVDKDMQGHFSLWPGSVTIRSMAKNKKNRAGG